MDVFLETERLILRRFTADDVDNLVALDSDPAVMRHLSGGAPTPRAAIEERMPRYLAYYERHVGYGFWAVIEKATGEFIGWFHLRPHEGSPPDEPELGYRLRRASWGKGYGTEGSRALIRKAFTELGARRIVASTYQDNIASRRVMEKAGLTFVRTFRYTEEALAAQNTHTGAGGLWEGDDVEYALTQADWERQEAVHRGE